MTTVRQLFHTATITPQDLARCDSVTLLATVEDTGALLLVHTRPDEGHGFLAYPHAHRPLRRVTLKTTARQLLRSLGYTSSSLHLVDIAPPPAGSAVRRPTAVYAAVVQPAGHAHENARALTVTRTEVACMDLRPLRVTELFMRAGATPSLVVRELVERRRHDASFIEIDR